MQGRSGTLRRGALVSVQELLPPATQRGSCQVHAQCRQHRPQTITAQTLMKVDNASDLATTKLCAIGPSAIQTETTVHSLMVARSGALWTFTGVEIGCARMNPCAVLPISIRTEATVLATSVDFGEDQATVGSPEVRPSVTGACFHATSARLRACHMGSD